MKVTTISSASTPSVFPHSDTVTGVLAGRHELDALMRVLEPLGVSAVEVLEGPTGVGYLDRREHSFRAFLDFITDDMADDMCPRYAHEVEQGRLVFAVPVTHGNKEDVVAAVLAQGASHVVHFGKWVGENIGRP
jgi:hypothetical protein